MMILAIASTVMMTLAPNWGADTKTTVEISGSTTVAPFSIAVGAHLSDAVKLEITQTGTGAGIADLCAGDESGVDIAAASRMIKGDELQRCAEQGIKTLVEIPLGRDGIVLAQSQKTKDMALTPKDLYLALARNTPRSDDECVIVPNRRTHWDQVRPDLPKREILVIGPPATSGTRDMLMSLIMRAGARNISCLKAQESRSPAFFEKALVLRTDGLWVDGGESDHAIAHTILHVHHALGIFGFAHLTKTPGIKAVALNGVLPTAQTIFDGSYLASRKLYLYTTGYSIAESPEVNTVLDRFFTIEAIGPTGFLPNIGLVPNNIPGERTLVNTQGGHRTPMARRDN